MLLFVTPIPELKRKHKITVKISDLIAMYVRHGVKKTERLLGLKSDEESQDIIDDLEKSNVDTKEGVEIGEKHI